MIQAIGLTGALGDQGPAVDDLTFQASPGQVTVLFGGPGAGKTHAVRLMLRLARGRGTTLFRGRPLHRIPHPDREVGVVLGGPVGHPRRTLRGHLRMLAPTAGVPTSQADAVLDVVGLAAVADHRLGRCSRGMVLRLALATALLGDPHTLVLDTPLQRLSERDRAWLRGLLRGFAQAGGTVLATSNDAQETAAVADRVVTLGGGRLLADQPAADFARDRLRSRVAVRSPQADRLAVVLAGEFPTPASSHDTAEQPLTVVRRSSDRLEVYGSSCVRVGETAHRHGIPLHRLEAETSCAHEGPAEKTASPETRALAVPAGRAAGADHRPGAAPALVPRPSRPVRYELRRIATTPAGWLLGTGAVLATCAVALLLGRPEQSALRAVTGWHEALPLPPVALAAGLLGALAFREERRYATLHPAYTGLRRRPPLVTAKALVNGALAVLLYLVCVLAAALVAVLRWGVAGGAALTAEGPGAVAAGGALALGCCWCGLLGAALTRSAVGGLGGLLALSVVAVPVTGTLAAGSTEGLGRGWEPLVTGPLTGDPLARAVILSSAALVCAWGLVAAIARARRAGRPGVRLSGRQGTASPQLRTPRGRPAAEVASTAQAVR